MSFNNQNLVRSINKPNRFGGKENNHSLSPNVRPIRAVNKPIQNNLFPKNQLMFSNNKHNYNIKVNKITRQKEKIIEGELNFNNISKPFYIKNNPKHNILGNKTKNRGMPRKSPLPISGSFKPKDILNFNRIFSSNSRIARQEQKKFNRTNNMFKPSGNNNFMNNYIFGGHLNANMSKSFNSFNKKIDNRSHSPLLRTGENKAMNLGIKGNKNRYVSKSPNLGKNSLFNRNGNNFSISFLNNNNGKKRIVKKTPNHNNNSNITNNKKINNINPSQKRNTIISGEFSQEPLKENKFNHNNNFHNNNINKGSNIPNPNIRPISMHNASSNNLNNNLHYNYSNNNINPLRNNNSNSNENILKNNFVYLNNSNSSNNNIIKNNQRPTSPKNIIDNNNNRNNNVNNNNHINVNINNKDRNSNDNKLNNNNNNNKINSNINIKKEELNIKSINNVPKQDNINTNNNEIKDNNQSMKPIQNTAKLNIQNKEEQNIPKEKPQSNSIVHPEESSSSQPKKIRSQSQTPNNPLNDNNPNSNEPKKKKEEDDNLKKIEEIPKNIPVTNKVIKKIKDILPYSHVGFDGEEPKENNQDNYFIFKDFAGNKDYIYLSVCDGHGVEGHFVSEFIKEVLPYYMSENLKNRNILSETDKEIIHQIITETFLIVNNMLVSNENINSLFSGSTCVSVIFTPERLIVPNIGDSRAVLARFDQSTGKYKAIDLSRDHKPTEKDEAKRIYENDGRIQPFTEDGEFVGPQRVWIKEEEVPGLAMTRSFGDRVAATVGVMSEPEIKEFNFDENDKYMIIASDGIWEFISSQECIDMIQKFYESNDLKGCCEYLYQESSKRWLKEEEVIDDTTLILVFFE